MPQIVVDLFEQGGCMLLTCLLFALTYLVWRFCPWWHVWEYRNPYARTCRRCGRHEHLFGYGLHPDVTDTWEQVYPLPHSPEKCRQQDSDH